MLVLAVLLVLKWQKEAKDARRGGGDGDDGLSHPGERGALAPRERAHPRRSRDGSACLGRGFRFSGRRALGPLS